MLVQPLLRQPDDYGEGHYGASRGSRTHKGIDFCAVPNQLVCSHIDGIVSKLGYPYVDDLSFRYVEITTASGFSHRFFYVEPDPLLHLNDEVKVGEVIGKCQDSGIRYNKNGKTITNHVHYEVVTYEDGKKVYHDPNGFI